MKRLVAAAVVAIIASPADAAGLFTSTYDDAIRSAVKQQWIDYPNWLFWKAQLYQESRFDPGARSPVGAAGLAQFMPATWADVMHQLGWSGISANQAGPAIQAGAYYMRRLRQGWTAPRPSLERHLLGLASYNAGTGNVVRAQALCAGARDFAQIAPCLPAVTGPLASQTVDYVARTQQWYRLLGGS